MVQKRDPRGIGRKGGFKSLGSHLPQNAYKGKVEKIREGLIHNAKVKRAYYRTLKREEKAGTLPTLPSENFEEIGAADLETFHPSRSKALAPRESHEGSVQREEASQPKIKLPRRQLTKAEKLALEEEQRKEKERNQKEREKKIRQREKKRKDLRKMTSKGQPVMKTRLEDLLGKVRKVMKEG